MIEPARIDSVDDFLHQMRDCGVTFGREDGALRVTAPKGRLSTADAAYIRDHKVEILSALGDDNTLTSPTTAGSLREPLSYQQEKIWSHQLMFPEMSLYNLATAWRLHGDLDTAAFARAFGRVVARHDVLRARFEMIDGAPFVSYREAVQVELPVEDLGPELSDRDLVAELETLRDAPMALDRGEVFRARLLRRTAREHVFFFSPHHIVWDGLSWDVFFRELSAFYVEETGGDGADLPPLTNRYADFAATHRRWMKSGAPEKELEYWRTYYSSDTPPLALPADVKRPKLFTYEGSAVSFDLPADVVSSVRALATQSRCTPFVVYLTAWQAYLHRITGQSDIVVGAPVQGRQDEGAADLIGCFGNVLGLRAQVDAAGSFSSMLARTRATFFDVIERQQTPVEFLASELRGSRDVSRTALFQALFTYQNETERPQRIGDIALETIDIAPGGAPTDIRLEITETGEAATGEVNYATDVVNAEGAKHLADGFMVFLADALAHPDKRIADIEVMSAESKRCVLSEWNETNTDYRWDALAFDYFDEAAAAHPDAPAISIGEKSLTYAQLQSRANRIAHLLRGEGVEEGDIVAVYMNRSIDMIASILGVWKAGAALLPIDPEFPQNRLAYMLEDARAKAVLSVTPLIEDWLVAAAPVIDLEARAAALDAMPETAPAIGRDRAAERAYVIYTSGSTGDPKGVENSHRALCNFIEGMMREPGMVREDRLLAVTTISFDVMLLELFVTLSAGAEIVLATEDEGMDGFALADLIERRDITVLQGTPATWRILFDAEWRGKADLKALCGGEAMPADLADRLPKLAGELWNMYGPTETTVWSTCALIEDASNIHVGRPIQNTKVYVLDDFGNPAPVGVAGDLWIGGDGVALGYLGKPALTAERFRDNPFEPSAGRIYNTGDRARWRRDGTMEILGRRDEQIKVRGYRIELGDIEAAINKHPAVREAAAALRDDQSGEASLVAYVVFKDGLSATNSELRRFMREHVPHYMTPQFFMELSALPLTNNNKIDRKALPAPAGVAASARRVAPRTQREIALADIWSDILRAPEISVTDNFFELGGQSLQAARMIARARDAIGLTISAREVIFETLEQLAADCVAA